MCASFSRNHLKSLFLDAARFPWLNVVSNELGLCPSINPPGKTSTVVKHHFSTTFVWIPVQNLIKVLFLILIFYYIYISLVARTVHQFSAGVYKYHPIVFQTKPNLCVQYLTLLLTSLVFHIFR